MNNLNIDYKIVLIVVAIVLFLYMVFYSEDNNKKQLEHATNVSKDCKNLCKTECDKKCENCEKKCKKMKGTKKKSCLDKCKKKQCSKKNKNKCKKKCQKKCKKNGTDKTAVASDEQDDSTDVESDTAEVEKESEASGNMPSRNEIDEMIKRAIDEKTNNEPDFAGIRFSKKWTGYPDDKIDASEISNDIDNYKKLMIVGNKSGGGKRRVGIWDELDVNGKLTVNGELCVGNTCISEAQFQKLK